MKIIELDGLIKLEAEEGKVITTLTPSNLRAKLIYLNKNNINNYIEVNEEPEIELTEEPDIEGPEEILNGYTLAEAYYQLINENRILKEENQIQNELINITMMATDEMYMMLEPLLINISTYEKGGVNPMVDMYIAMVQRGLKKTEDVPVRYREQVIEILKQLKD